ncbi:MAG: NYN domain-containing protein [Nanoarchaeota archaeon]|nr:NYN domain-containing protein [Nanoarchaeota archaeon]
MEKRSAIVFIDGSNFYHNSKSIIDKPSKIDFRCLSDFICNYFGLTLKQIRYYNAVPDITDDKVIYYKHMEFLERLRKKGIIVKDRKLKKIKELKIKIEKGIDVMIASDMIRKTLVEKECKVCILVSGDADFIPAMEIIKDAKYEVIVCSPKFGFSNELRQGKFRYLILNKEDLEKCLNLRRVALIVPCNNKFEIILQRRKGFIDKPTDRDYGFFGGGLEEGESVEEALKREVMEELTLDIQEINSLKFFKTYQYESKEKNMMVELNVFLCDIKDVIKMDVKEGKPITLKIETAISSNISEMDKKVLKEIYIYINNKMDKISKN